MGSTIEIEDIIEGYRPKAIQVYFPLPQAYDPRTPLAPDTQGELLIVFPPAAFAE